VFEGDDTMPESARDPVLMQGPEAPRRLLILDTPALRLAAAHG
jgi:hypothetical protein